MYHFQVGEKRDFCIGCPIRGSCKRSRVYRHYKIFKSYRFFCPWQLALAIVKLILGGAPESEPASQRIGKPYL